MGLGWDWDGIGMGLGLGWDGIGIGMGWDLRRNSCLIWDVSPAGLCVHSQLRLCDVRRVLSPTRRSNHRGGAIGRHAGDAGSNPIPSHPIPPHTFSPHPIRSLPAPPCPAQAMQDPIPSRPAQAMQDLVNETLADTREISLGCSNLLDDAAGCGEMVGKGLEQIKEGLLSGLLLSVPEAFASRVTQIALGITDAELPWYALDGLVPQARHRPPPSALLPAILTPSFHPPSSLLS